MGPVRCSVSILQALAKFLKCVKWDIAGEKKQALELLNKWAPMDVQDALELLGPQFTQTEVRIYAVARLRKAPDEVCSMSKCTHISYRSQYDMTSCNCGSLPRTCIYIYFNWYKHLSMRTRTRYVPH